jgi:FkbM family methyltransferase
MRPELLQTTKLLSKYITPTSVLEIGSRDGHDAHEICKFFNIDPEECVIVEAHPDLYNTICETYPQYNVYNFAASNKDGVVQFRAGVVGHESNVGVSSLMVHKTYHHYHEKVNVSMFRMDQRVIKDFDLLKLDVEGHAYEVLEGFGERLNKIKAIAVETEEIELWEDQKIHDQVQQLLEDKGFVLVDKQRAWDAQFDCLFVNKEFVRFD